MKKNLMLLAAFALSSATVMTSCKSSDDNVDPNGSVDELAVLAGTISENVTLESGKSYELDGAYTVPAGKTLTIEEGVTITALDGGEVDFILVQQGGKIMAQGTADAPIVMTSELKEHGAWGGVHICGYAETNIGEGTSEVGSSPYGGDDNSDNSGVLSYIRVEYAGYLYSEDKECNGFTFYGVGNGTTVDHLEAYKGSDDGYEWFGGCVNASYLVSIDNQDDAFDWTYGYTGTINNAYAKHLSDKCDHLVEGDSNKTNPGTTLPISHPTIKNAVLVGVDRGSDNRGLRIRRGSKVTLENVEVSGKTNSFDFQSEETKAYFTENAATALVNVKATGAIIDADANEPLSASIFAGLTIDADLESAIPDWASGSWVVVK
ncbi:MAG: hypothetical protein R3Y08_05920 [Rikenellaceae bacterium]